MGLDEVPLRQGEAYSRTDDAEPQDCGDGQRRPAPVVGPQGPGADRGPRPAGVVVIGAASWASMTDIAAGGSVRQLRIDG